MRPEILEYLRCPSDDKHLELFTNSEPEADGHVLSGRLVCTECGQNYPIMQGVPDFVGDIDGEKGLLRIRRDTADRFGYEWQFYKNWGWLDKHPPVRDGELRYFGALLENTLAAFDAKSLLPEENLQAGCVVFDGGCGNGRFTYSAARKGATVIGADLSAAVFTAFENTRHLPNAHIVRGDLFKPPVVKRRFTTVFSIGVLMHTGSAPRAFAAISELVAPGGRIVAHVYGKGWRSYEILDATIRAVSTRVPKQLQMGFAKLTAGIARWFWRKPGRRRFFDRHVYPHINLLPTDHHMFDWWAAPVATHHELPEVVEWFEKAGLSVEATRPVDDPANIAEARALHGTVTVRGRREPQSA